MEATAGQSGTETNNITAAVGTALPVTMAGATTAVTTMVIQVGARAVTVPGQAVTAQRKIMAATNRATAAIAPTTAACSNAMATGDKCRPHRATQGITTTPPTPPSTETTMSSINATLARPPTARCSNANLTPLATWWATRRPVAMVARNASRATIATATTLAAKRNRWTTKVSPTSEPTNHKQRTEATMTRTATGNQVSKLTEFLTKNGTAM